MFKFSDYRSTSVLPYRPSDYVESLFVTKSRLAKFERKKPCGFFCGDILNLMSNMEVLGFYLIFAPLFLPFVYLYRLQKGMNINADTAVSSSFVFSIGLAPCYLYYAALAIFVIYDNYGFDYGGWVGFDLQIVYLSLITIIIFTVSLFYVTKYIKKNYQESNFLWVGFWRTLGVSFLISIMTFIIVFPLFV